MKISYKLLYKLLNLQSDASLKDAKISYRRLIQQWHPDRFNESSSDYPKAHKMFLEVSKAYKQLHSFHQIHNKLPYETDQFDETEELSEVCAINLSRRTPGKSTTTNKTRKIGSTITLIIALVLCSYLIYSSKKENEAANLRSTMSYSTQNIPWKQQLNYDMNQGKFLGTTKTSVGETLSKQLYR